LLDRAKESTLTLEEKSELDHFLALRRLRQGNWTLF
jgi:hypothetical protein